MQNQHLISYKDEFSAIAEEGINLCRKYEKTLSNKDAREKIKSVADQIDADVKARFQDFNPKIMVYGIYNAGKSTLLNALIGEEKAKMADNPTTKIVQEYRWKEYTIYDTPGIGAPDKNEEEVSKDQLQKCDVILFVTDTEGGFSLGKNYQELIDIIKSGKRLLIVLNHKSGSDSINTDADDQVKSNIYDQFAKAYGNATPTELAKKASIISVNARTALDARIKYTGKGQEIMLEKSNIADLEKAIIQEYRKAKDGFTILNELSIQLNKGLEELLSLLKNSIKDKDGIHSEESKYREELRDLQDNLIRKVTEHIHDSADDLDARFFNVMLNAINEGQADNDEIREGIQEEAKQWAEQINDFMIEEREKCSQRYREMLRKFIEALRIKSGDIGSIDLPGAVSAGDSELNGMNVDVSAIGGKDMGEIGKQVAMDTAVIGGSITGILTALASSSVACIATAASAMVPYVGPLVALVSLIVRGLSGDDDAEKGRRIEEIRAGNEAERRRAIQKERLMYELKEKSRRFSRKISTDMISRASDSIANGFASVMEQLDKDIVGNSKEKEAINNDIRITEHLKARLDKQIATYRNM